MQMTMQGSVTQTAPNAAAFHALGTEIEVIVTDAEQLPAIVEHVQRRIDAIDRTFSRFRVDSELSRLEQLPNIRQPASPFFLELLELALRAARATGGWFDPTIRDALEAAGYDRSIDLIEAEGPGENRPGLPAGQWERIRFDRERRWVIIPDGVRLDFGGIGKGFAVDDALRTLSPHHCGVLINAGGDLAVRGPAPAGGWLCDISAAAGTRVETSVAIHEGALATSGLGRRQWVRDGSHLHHLIDPHTGVPGRSPWRTVTVAARECTAAEVAAKVAWLKGDDGPVWLTGLGLAGRFVARDGTIVSVGSWPGEELDT